jgi:hypothetical protein
MIAMAEIQTDDVRDSLDHLSTVEFETSDNANGVRVAVAEEDIGHFWQAVRVNNLQGATTSKRIGDSLVAHIEAEESNSLGDLFR